MTVRERRRRQSDPGIAPHDLGIAAAGLEDELDPVALPANRTESAGTLLKEAREARGGNLMQISATLRIRPEHLRAIEAGTYADLPAPIYAIGFIRSYAQLLGLDSAEMVHRFKRELGGQPLARKLAFPEPLHQRRIPVAGAMAGLVALALCGFGAWHGISGARQDRDGGVTAPPSAELVAPPATAAPAPIPVATTVAASTAAPSSLSPTVGTALPAVQARAEPPPPSGSAVPATSVPSPPTDPVHIFGATGDGHSRIALRATAETWIEVKSGDTSVFRKLLKAGDEYRLPERPGLSLHIGNAHGIEVLADGKPLPSAAQPSQGRRVVVTLQASELLAKAGEQ